MIKFRAAVMSSLLCIFLSACGGSGGGDEGDPDAASSMHPATGVAGAGAAVESVVESATELLPSPTGYPGYQISDPRLARFFGPGGIALDRAGNLYVADAYNQTIRRIARNGTVTTLAGLPGWPGTEDGTGAAARFSSLGDMTIDRFGNLFVTDGYTVRKVTPEGRVTTLAGAPGQWGYADGRGSVARFNRPHGIAVDRDGNLYVADTNNARIRKITPYGVVSTLAGGYQDSATIIDGVGGAAGFDTPWGVALDRHGRLYVTDIAYRNVGIPDSGSTFIRRVNIGTGAVVTVAGNFGIPADPRAGAAETPAQFNEAQGIAVDHDGNVFVADFFNDQGRLRRLAPDGQATTIPTPTGAFGHLYDVTVHWQGTLLVSDSLRHTINLVTPTFEQRIYAGAAGDAGYNDTP